ncbi:MAG: DUF4440 domain-containing protein [Roseomonas sp.]|nr:DUF4440 domain-containing protein [Roseomonas sp.]
MTSTRNEACAAEIVALHKVFESWLGAPGQGDFTRFEAAFAEGFQMVLPSGARFDRPGILDFLQSARAVRGPGFRIVVEEIAMVDEAPGRALMHYVERQWFGSQETARRASALFDTTTTPPRWLFVQETWVTPPG